MHSEISSRSPARPTPNQPREKAEQKIHWALWKLNSIRPISNDELENVTTRVHQRANRRQVFLNRRESLIRADRGDRDRLAQDIPVVVGGVRGVVGVIELQQVRRVLTRPQSDLRRLQAGIELRRFFY